MTKEIYQATLFEEDLQNPEKEYKIEVFAIFEAPTMHDGEYDNDGGYVIKTVLCDNESTEIEDLAPKLYKWDKKGFERAMTAQELEYNIYQALNDQFDNALPF
jgi:hypothetical protein